MRRRRLWHAVHLTDGATQPVVLLAFGRARALVCFTDYRELFIYQCHMLDADDGRKVGPSKPEVSWEYMEVVS
ncbi:MAG: hypothetical protein ABI393_01250 [Paralcaligenes sp.]